MIWTVLVILAVVALDQWTKFLAIGHLRQISTLPVLENILHFTYVENRGAAFGMLAEHRWVFMVFSTAAILAIIVWLWHDKPKSVWIRLAAAFIVGGGIGNMIDRIALGEVIDFLKADFLDPLGGFPVFNGADSFVCVGAAILFVVLFIRIIAELKEEKKKKANAPEGADAKKTEESGHDSDGDA